MLAKQNLVRVSTRPLVLLVAVLSALAIGLIAIASMQPAATVPASNNFAFYQDRPGPDSPYRVKHDVPDPWSEAGR